MPPVHFKLTKSDGHTRRVTFQGLPSWEQLAAKLQALYDIPVEKVGVSYVDSDNDEITASSNEELQDFYQSSYKPDSAIKLSVVDLTINRDSTQSIPPSGVNRNTFSADNFEFVDNGWQGLNPRAFDFLGLGAGSEGPHAYVEVLSSDASGFAKENEDITDTESDEAQSTVQQPIHADKGKQRSSSFGAASTTSVLGEELLEKFPVHVYDHYAASRRLSFSKSQQGEIKRAESIAAQSTPKAPVEDLKMPEISSTADQKGASPEDIEDPPLPSLDEASASNASATLSHDVATLLTTFTQVISSHPELSEGVRNIVRNAASGTYWQAHRDTLSQVVSNLSQGVDGQQNEAEAGRRVADALGNIFRSLSAATSNVATESTQQAPAAGSASNGATQGDSDFRDTPVWGHRRPWARRSTTALDPHRSWAQPWHIPPWSFERMSPFYGGAPPPGPPPGMMHPFGPFPYGPPPPPPPPPPHHHHTNGHMPPLPPPSHMLPLPRELPLSPPLPPPPASQLAPEEKAPSNGPSSNGPPPPPPPPPGPFVHAPPPHVPGDNPPPRGPRHGPFPPHHQRYFSMRGNHHRPGGGFHPPPPPPPIYSSPDVPPPPPAAAAAGPNVPLPPPQPQAYNPFFSAAQKPGEQELREGIETTKRAYRAQKEAYRQLREERKKEKEGRKGSDGTAKVTVPSEAAAPLQEGTSQLVSNAWGDYPQLEMYSVPGGPRRYHTHLGHGRNAQRIERKPEDLNARAQARIAKRLADMGFSENSFPDLPAKIKAEMPAIGVISKDGEDNVVTTLLEELLARSSRSPVGSGSNDLDKMAGAWH